MRTIARLALLAVVTFAISTPPTLADEPKGDLARLQGTWKVMIGPNKDIPYKIVVDGFKSEITFLAADGEMHGVKGEIQVDENASPKTFDLTKFASVRGKVTPDNLSIYKLDGDTWTVCMGGVGNGRPTKFEAAEFGFPKIYVFNRVKPTTAEEKPIPGDLGKIQGAWLTLAGPKDELVISITVKVNAYTARSDRGDGTKVDLRGELRVNEKATPNKTIDFFDTKRDDGEDARDSLGIYEFDGDKLKVCVGGPGEERPTEFKKGTEGTPRILIFTRKKD